MSLHWIIGNNVCNERGYDVLIDTVERFKLPYTLVRVIPFSHELIPDDIPAPGLKVVMGSITLGKVAEKRGWCPGVFTNSNFHYREWRKHYVDHLLNDDATICRFEDVKWYDDWRDFFIRPCLDDKSFSGSVMNWHDFKAWKYKVLELKEDYTTLDADTEVCYGSPKEIYQEFRFFVVDGKVITGSQYKIGRRVHASREAVTPLVWNFAQQMVDLWQPHRAFAIDVADTPNGLKVIEIGCLNSCGFYDSDVQKLTMTINAMEF